MSEKHLHSIHGNAVSKETLLAYVHGNLSVVEKQRIDDLLREDPFLQDAVEGLQFADPATINDTLNAINKKIDMRTGVGQTVQWMPAVRKYAVAATLIVFTTISILVIMQLNKTSDRNSMHERAEVIIPDTITNSGMGGGSQAADSAADGELAFENKITTKTNAVSTENSDRAESINNVQLAKTENAVVSTDQEINSGEIEKPVSINDEEKSLNSVTVTAEQTTLFSTGSNAGSLSEDTNIQQTEGRTEDKKSRGNKKNTNKDEIASAPATTKADDLDMAIPRDSVATIYTAVDVQPSFKGGMDSLNQFLARNIHYPPDQNEEGNVYVKFVINETGQVSDATILKGFGKKFDDEALRVINLMPAWNPGIKNGKPVKVYYAMVVKFSIN